MSKISKNNEKRKSKEKYNEKEVKRVIPLLSDQNIKKKNSHTLKVINHFFPSHSFIVICIKYEIKKDSFSCL